MNTHEPSLLGIADIADDGAGPRLTVEQAFQRYRHGLLSFLRQRLNNKDDAEDVLQETYIRLIQHYREELDERTASTLIFRIGANAANDLVRRRRARHAGDHCSVDKVALVSDEPTQERRESARQELALLYDAIAELPPKCRQVFLLNRVQHMTYPEVAKYCGISVKMVEKHIGKALAVLRAKVGDQP